MKAYLYLPLDDLSYRIYILCGILSFIITLYLPKNTEAQFIYKVSNETNTYTNTKDITKHQSGEEKVSTIKLQQQSIYR